MIEISKLCFSYASTIVLDGLSLKLNSGAWLGLSGDSGSGKTTLLRLIAGLTLPTAGQISLAGTLVSRPDWCLDAHRRGLSMVFQNPALFPHLSVAENVAFAVPPGKENDRIQRTTELLEEVNVADLADRKPAELSGGQARRVALARALGPGASILLLDEPFVHLPPETAERMRRLIEKHVAESGTTVIEVNHRLDSGGSDTCKMRLEGGRLHEEN